MAEREFSLASIVLILIALMLLFALGLISLFMRYQLRKNDLLKENVQVKKNFEQELLRTTIEVQEATFSTLGKELHDNIGQLLSTTKMLIGITERSIVNPPDTLHTANETLGKAINELRSLSKSLNKEWLEQFNLIENLNAEVERINSSGIIQVHTLHPPKIYLKSDAQIILFRIIQEGLQNAIKHSDASNIEIELRTSNNILLTSITDNGHGFQLNTAPEGLGILNMKQRTKLLGGSIQWISGDNGCGVVIEIPIKSDTL